MMNIKEWLTNFFLEDVEEEIEDEDELEVVEKKINKTANIEKAKPVEIKTDEPTPVTLKTDTVTVDVKPIENTSTVKQNTSAFLNVTPPVVKKEEPVVEETTTKPARTYIPNQVISPIFGATQEDVLVRPAQQEFVFQNETAPESIIGTIFSPINGRMVVEEVKEDVVDEKIASMQVNDFLNTVQIERTTEHTMPLQSVVEEEKPQETPTKQPEIVEPIIKQPFTFIYDSNPVKKTIEPVREEQVKPQTESQQVKDIANELDQIIKETFDNAQKSIDEVQKEIDEEQKSEEYENLTLF